MEGYFKIGNIRGPKGDTGTGLTIKGFYADTEELFAAVTNPNVGDAYGVGEEGAYDIYIYSTNKGWVNSGELQPDINEQAPNYAEATTLETLTSGEKISIAFGKIKKAIREFISHKANTTNHITSEERTAWNEMLHTGNIDNHIKIVSGSYVGNGKFGSSNKNSIPLDIIPQVMIISRGSGTPYKLTETSIISFAYDSANERYVANTNKVLAGNEYSYSPSLNMCYANGKIQWYTDSADSNRYKTDLQSGYITFETLTYSGSEANKMKSINQLNWSDCIYHYSIIGKKE